MWQSVIAIVVASLCLLALIPLLTHAVFQASRQRIGYIPLPARAVPAVIKALAINDHGALYDLGCGDARILAAALKSHPHLAGVGVEYNPLVARLARWRTRSLASRLRIVRGDLMAQDLSPARYLFTYLSPPQMALLEPKLERELVTGARLVSCDFPLPSRTPTTTVPIGNQNQLGQTLFIYQF